MVERRSSRRLHHYRHGRFPGVGPELVVTCVWQWLSFGRAGGFNWDPRRACDIARSGDHRQPTATGCAAADSTAISANSDGFQVPYKPSSCGHVDDGQVAGYIDHSYRRCSAGQTPRRAVLANVRQARRPRFFDGLVEFDRVERRPGGAHSRCCPHRRRLFFGGPSATTASVGLPSG